MAERTTHAEWRVVGVSSLTRTRGNEHYHATRLNAEKHQRELVKFWRERDAPIDVVIERREVSDWRLA